MIRFNPLLLINASIALAIGLLTYGFASFLLGTGHIPQGLGFVFGGAVFAIADIFFSENLDADDGLLGRIAQQYELSNRWLPYWCYGLVVIAGGITLLFFSD